MADNHTPEQRRYNMSMIRGKDTKPEVMVRRYLFSQGFRYRKNVRKLPGTPDIVLKRYNTCIFVNGCFWHKHEGCKYFVWPKSNTEYWQNKIERNVANDVRNYSLLKDHGWKVVVVWECELKNHFEETMKNVTSILLNT